MDTEATGWASLLGGRPRCLSGVAQGREHQQSTGCFLVADGKLADRVARPCAAARARGSERGVADTSHS